VAAWPVEDKINVPVCIAVVEDVEWGVEEGGRFSVEFYVTMLATYA